MEDNETANVVGSEEASKAVPEDHASGITIHSEEIKSSEELSEYLNWMLEVGKIPNWH